MISFTPEEREMYGFQQVPAGNGQTKTSWNPVKAAENIKDIPVDEYTTNLIRDELQKMSSKHKLTDDYYSLYEKFIVMYTSP